MVFNVFLWNIILIWCFMIKCSPSKSNLRLELSVCNLLPFVLITIIKCILNEAIELMSFY